MLRRAERDAAHPQTRAKPHGERYGTERDGTEGRDCNGKSSSLRTDWKGLGQDHQEHVRWDFAGGQAAGQGLHVGAQKQRPTEGRALIDGLTYVRMPRSMTLSPTVARFDDILVHELASACLPSGFSDLRSWLLMMTPPRLGEPER